MQQKSEESLA